ncbi:MULTISPECIES: DUF6653 family protein [unclassified Paenibacillus]|uniref:DUF6653 family protein n=1 Tax=unclassified Paenibacillus TaxID=185978 RepID=UPI001C11667B|nr:MULTISPECIES: DUF6653 family protein [unclassified Paenibacillus]MBU5441148.1 hypothetical protein [Paenibacillus sp. MSJ-34]CAH0120528.1 hypothetical protein PAE9249_03047 [Paenibacillus sp. CECT 9249]
MTLERKISNMYKLDDRAWLRHANPWSVWTRNSVMPLLILAFWSRTWIGWWAAVPVALAVAWAMVNPHIFPAPRSTDHWASKCVFGERLWLNRDRVPIPASHKRLPNLLSAIAGIGALFVMIGVFRFDLWMTLFGCALVYMGKLWFLDRMVWIYEDMNRHPGGENREK